MMGSMPSLTKSNQPVATGRSTAIVTFRDGSSKLTWRSPFAVYSTFPCWFPKADLPLAVRRPQISQRSIVLAQKRAPVLGNLEAAVRDVTGELDLYCGASIVDAGTADPHAAHPAARTAEFDRKCLARIVGNSLRRRAIAVDRSREQFGGSVRYFGQHHRQRVMQPIVREFDAHQRRGGGMGKRDGRPQQGQCQPRPRNATGHGAPPSCSHASATNPGSSAISRLPSSLA